VPPLLSPHHIPSHRTAPHRTAPQPSSSSSSSSSSTTDPALFLRILQAEKEGFLSYTLDAPGAAAAAPQDDEGYASRGPTEWEEALRKVARYYQPPEAGDNDAMVMVRAGLRSGKAGWLAERECGGVFGGVDVCVLSVSIAVP